VTKGRGLVYLMLAGGAGSILTGLPYVYRFFGPTEAEVVLWGTVSVYMGIAIIVSSLVLGYIGLKLAGPVLIAEFIFLGGTLGPGWDHSRHRSGKGTAGRGYSASRIWPRPSKNWMTPRYWTSSSGC